MFHRGISTHAVTAVSAPRLSVRSTPCGPTQYGRTTDGMPSPHPAFEHGAGALAEIVNLMYDGGGHIVEFEEIAAAHVPVRPLVSRVTGSRSSGHLESQLSLTQISESENPALRFAWRKVFTSPNNAFPGETWEW